MFTLQNNFEIFSPPKDLLDDFEVFNRKNTGKTKQLQDSIAICSKIMNIRKPPYILNYHPYATEAVANKMKEQQHQNFRSAILEAQKVKEMVC